ncbi:MAG: hypothetical protein HOO98_06890, partial [Nitrospira sp.]|nr:hypothetical protein [Nitrospira sp.]
MDTTRAPRELTHDERKAADAAFGGRPCNPVWSESAKRVYEGLIHALPALPDEVVVTLNQNPPGEKSPLETAPALPIAAEPKLENPTHSGNALEMRTDIPANQLIANRQQAIQAGFLIDVSTDAQKLGLTFPVTVT